MGRFYSNENIARQVVVELQNLGHDVLTSFDAGNANISVPDEKVLAFATAQARVLLSHNRRHFLRLPEKQNHAGIILCTFDNDFKSLAERIDAAVKNVFELTNQVIRITLDSYSSIIPNSIPGGAASQTAAVDSSVRL